jgi:hypothetical protein
VLCAGDIKEGNGTLAVAPGSHLQFYRYQTPLKDYPLPGDYKALEMSLKWVTAEAVSLIFPFKCCCFG